MFSLRDAGSSWLYGTFSQIWQRKHQNFGTCLRKRTAALVAGTDRSLESMDLRVTMWKKRSSCGGLRVVMPPLFREWG